MSLSERIRRLRALIARPGTPEEGKAAERALRALLDRFGEHASERVLSAPSELRLVRWGGSVFVYESDPFIAECLIAGLEPAEGCHPDTLHSFILTEASVMAPDGPRSTPRMPSSRPACADYRLLSKAEGETLVQPGEYLRVVLMPNPGMPFHSFLDPRRVRIAIRFASRAERLPPHE